MMLCHGKIFAMLDRMEEKVLKEFATNIITTDSNTAEATSKIGPYQRERAQVKVDTIRLVKDRIRIEFLT